MIVSDLDYMENYSSVSITIDSDLDYMENYASASITGGSVPVVEKVIITQRAATRASGVSLGGDSNSLADSTARVVLFI